MVADEGREPPGSVRWVPLVPRGRFIRDVRSSAGVKGRPKVGRRATLGERDYSFEAGRTLVGGRGSRLSCSVMLVWRRARDPADLLRLRRTGILRHSRKG